MHTSAVNRESYGRNKGCIRMQKPRSAPTLTSTLHIKPYELISSSHPYSRALAETSGACLHMAAHQTHAVPGLTLPWTEVLPTTSEPSPPQLMGPSLMALLLFGTRGSAAAPGSAAPLIRPQSRRRRQGCNLRPGRRTWCLSDQLCKQFSLISSPQE